MPYGLISKVSENGREFHMFCNEGYVHCRMSRSLFKRVGDTIKRNMVVTIDLDDDDSDTEVTREEPWKLVYLSTLQKAVILVTGSQDLVDDVRKNVKYSRVRVFENITKKKDPEIRLVAANGKVTTFSELPRKLRKMGSIYTDIASAVRDGDVSSDSSSIEKPRSKGDRRVLAAEAPRNYSDDELNGLMTTHSGTVAALRNLIEGRIQAVQTTLTAYISDPTSLNSLHSQVVERDPNQFQVPQPPPSLLAQLDARDEHTRAAIAQFSTFLSRDMNHQADQIQPTAPVNLPQGQLGPSAQPPPTGGNQQHGNAQ